MKTVRRLLSGLTALAAVAVLAALILAWHQGYRVYIVHTGSMIPAFRPGEALVDGPVIGPLHRGEIITFRYASGPDQVVSHRVFSDVGGVIRTKGDANPTKDPWTLRRSQVVGTPIAIVPDGGYALYYLSQPAGAASLALFGVTTWLLWGLCFAPDEPAVADEAEPVGEPEVTGAGSLRALAVTEAIPVVE
ncbi:MAG: signal peptidase I [Streptosporangiaceae bacterium]